MTFEEAARRYADLRARAQAGQLTAEQFAAAVSQLRVQDQRGVWWQLHPNGSWVYWDGRAWQAAPSQAAPAAGRPAYAPPGGTSSGRAAAGQAATAGRVAPTARRAVRGGKVPLAQRSQHWFDMASIAGGGIAGALWYIYSSIRSSYEGKDLLTPLIMVLLPVAIVLLRKPIDRLLALLDPIRRRIPRAVLIGAGLAAPFVVAMLLYGKYTEYPYLRISTVVGTLLSYAIIRTPVTARGAAPAVRRAGGGR